MSRAGDYHESIGNSVMQFTGEIDKNGKEIYEGDIVKITNTLEQVSLITTVQFEQAAFMVECEGVYGDGDYAYTSIGIASADDDIEVEVIGNIHENPELKEKKS